MGKRCRVKRVPEKGDLDALETSRPVLVVSEDAQIEDIVVPPFRRAGLRTDKVGSGEAALAAVERRRPALILIDLKLEDMTGYELCHELKQRFDGVSIILMSDDRTEPHDRVAGLLLGADDYLPKPFHPSELLARARRLLPGSTGNGVSNDFGLTPRQLEVLRLLGQGLGREAVARELFVSPKTVASHVQNILTKLGVHSAAEAVAVAYRDGLIKEEETSTRTTSELSV